MLISEVGVSLKFASGGLKSDGFEEIRKKGFLIKSTDTMQ